MIKKYILGTPFDTEAAVLSVEAQSGSLPYFSQSGSTLRYSMSDEDIVYGLGENMRGINKRGFRYRSMNRDAGAHHECSESLYAAHNFLIIDGKERFGVFVDCPAELIFDIGFDKYDELKIEISGGNANIYIIEEGSLCGIASELRRLTGKSYIAPKWAFGYIQSRWGYKDSAQVREVAQRHAEAGCPLDGICLDLDYMEDYKDFSISRERFPDFEELVSELKAKGVRLVPIIDAAIKRQEGYEVYDEGLEKGFFCKDKDGEAYTVAVWPGRSCLPDFLNPEARSWFGGLYKKLIDIGIDGFWNDMNEPAIFYSRETLKLAFDCADELRKKDNIENEDYFRLCHSFNAQLRSEMHYKLFYHETAVGKIAHDKLHNIYGFNMTRAACEGFGKIAPDRRLLLFSRSSYIGAHRCGGVWTGDNSAWWSHLALSMKQMPSLNMCGFLYCGSDLGGFGDNVSEDLLIRWLQLGIFAPLMRNHSAWDSREKEVYQFESEKYLVEIIKLRYRLLPYLYSEFLKAALTDDMLFKPLGFVYENDPDARRVEDQLIWGESVMIAPVLEQNARGRYVYLPEEMLMLRFSSSTEYEAKPMSAGRHYIDVSLRELVIFVRKGHLLPLCQSAERVADIDASELEIIDFSGGEASYELLDDDGESVSGIASVKRVIRCEK